MFSSLARNFPRYFSRTLQNYGKKAVAYRDMTIPYTKIELEEIHQTFKSLATYKPEYGGTVSVDQVPEVLEAMRMERNPEQIQVYKDYWITHFNGRLHWDGVENILKNVHANDIYIKSLAENCDKDGDGFISADEFATLLDLLVKHDPEVGKLKISFGDFVIEADANSDGKISIEECREWVAKKTSK